ncbi:MAG: hypothetical protein ACK49N_03680 [Verrucomicrobiota bacterium]
MISGTSINLTKTDPTVQDSVEATDVFEACLEKTSHALLAVKAATPSEVAKAAELYRKSKSDGRPIDMLEATAKIQGRQEPQMSDAVKSLAEKVSITLNTAPPLIPFAGKLITPTAFYESFDRIHRIAADLLVPVIFVEDTDAIGVASINPIAAEMLSQIIQDAVSRRFGIRPFMTILRLDHESWSFLTRKHFGS